MSKTDFKRFGLMMDMSRNSVMNMPSLKKLIPALADMGYNFIMLYTEDTYEIPEEPYFGHFRGRYSQKELKEIVSFAEENGIAMPSFFGYILKFSLLVLLPVYALVQWIFF